MRCTLLSKLFYSTQKPFMLIISELLHTGISKLSMYILFNDTLPMASESLNICFPAFSFPSRPQQGMPSLFLPQLLLVCFRERSKFYASLHVLEPKSSLLCVFRETCNLNARQWLLVLIQQNYPVICGHEDHQNCLTYRTIGCSLS